MPTYVTLTDVKKRWGMRKKTSSLSCSLRNLREICLSSQRSTADSWWYHGREGSNSKSLRSWMAGCAMVQQGMWRFCATNLEHR